MDLSLVYAKCASFQPGKFLYFYNAYKANKNSDNTNFDYFKAFIKFRISKTKQLLVNSIIKILFPVIPNSQKLIEKITANKKPLCKDISECLEYIKAYQDKYGLKIQFEAEINQLKTNKEMWE